MESCEETVHQNMMLYLIIILSIISTEVHVCPEFNSLCATET